MSNVAHRSVTVVLDHGRENESIPTLAGLGVEGHSAPRIETCRAPMICNDLGIDSHHSPRLHRSDDREVTA